MILQFKFKNFRSVRDWQLFSLLAEKGVSEHKNSVIKKSNSYVLSSAIVYGRNASGKSNLLKAITALQHLVLDSSKFKVNTKIPQYQPYRFDVNSLKQPVEFKIDFLAKNDIKYHYEVRFNADTIEYEYLTFYPHLQPSRLFERNGMEIIYGSSLTGRKRDIEDTLYSNQLYLSKVGSEKLPALYEPYQFFSQLLFSYLDFEGKIEDTLIAIYSSRLGDINHKIFNDNLTKLIKAADINIDSFVLRERNFDENNLPEGLNEIEKESLLNRFRFKAGTKHKLFNDKQEVGSTELTLSDQSTGTLKLIVIGGLIIEALRDGQTLLIDELDKSLHPKLTRALINIFNSPDKNPRKAQLIFATHDVSLLDNNIFRRDQIWFSEKEHQGYSHYYSVADIDGIRKDAPLDKYYLNGRFGATPVIIDQDLSFEF